MTKARLLLVSCLVVACLGCEIGSRSGRGLRLPQGDVAKGEVAFLDLGCVRCHDVVGGPGARPGDPPRVIVTLGGEVTRVETYGELVTSIINPSHEISRRAPREDVADDGESKMYNFNDEMRVSQLIDLVAFLHAKYERRREPLYIP